MAFKTPTPELVAKSTEGLPSGVEFLLRRHDAAVADLLAVADTVGGPVKQEHITATLAAIKSYRSVMDPQDEEGRKTSPRVTLLHLAMYLIGAGIAPGRVCTALGYGRTSMNAEIAKGPAMFRALIEPGAKSVKKEVA